MVAKKSQTVDDNDKVVANTVPTVTDDNLRAVTTMGDGANLYGGLDSVKSVTDILGNGFSVLEDKSKLVDRQFLVVKYGEHLSSATGGYFVTLHVVTEAGEKWIVNDGSTGIMAQCLELNKLYDWNENTPNWLERGPGWLPLHVPRGLRASVYDYTGEDGVVKRATTYYLSTSR